MGRVQTSSLAFFIGLTVMAGFSSGENPSSSTGTKPIVLVAATVRVPGPEMTIGDIADIRGRPEDEDVKFLRQLAIGKSPRVGETKMLEAREILEVLKAAGFGADRIGYRLPEKVRVERAGAKPDHGELKSAIMSSLSNTERATWEIVTLELSDTLEVPVGPKSYRAQLANRNGKRAQFHLKVYQNDELVSDFSMAAEVNAWQPGCVARRALSKGQIITEDDLEEKSINLSQEAPDAGMTRGELTGKMVEAGISAGTVLRRSAVSVMPTIAKGARVRVKYASGGLSVFATAIALQDGETGKTITVRNESSRKIIQARVVDSEEAEVIQQ